MVAIYNHSVSTVDEVAEHLRFRPISRTSNGTTAFYTNLFRLRVNRYLRGTGHPSELRQRLVTLGVTDEDFVANASNHLLRTNLLLRCGTDSDMRPVDEGWNITVRKSICIWPRDSDAWLPVQGPWTWY